MNLLALAAIGGRRCKLIVCADYALAGQRGRRAADVGLAYGTSYQQFAETSHALIAQQTSTAFTQCNHKWVLAGLLLPCAMGSRVLMQSGTAPPTPELANALALTNFYRAQFQAPPLAWSATIYQLAADAIQNCTESPSVAGYGRNVGYGYVSWGAFINKTAADQASMAD